MQRNHNRINKVKSEVELVKLASELISLNTDKTLGWHVQK